MPKMFKWEISVVSSELICVKHLEQDLVGSVIKLLTIISNVPNINTLSFSIKSSQFFLCKTSQIHSSAALHPFS